MPGCPPQSRCRAVDAPQGHGRCQATSKTNPVATLKTDPPVGVLLTGCARAGIGAWHGAGGVVHALSMVPVPRDPKRRCGQGVGNPTSTSARGTASHAEACAQRRRSRGGGVEHAGAALLAQPVALPGDRQHVAVLEQPVEDRGGHHGVPEHLAPLAHRAVRRDHDAAALVAPRTAGKWTIFVAISMRRSFLRATSRPTRNATASRRVSCSRRPRRADCRAGRGCRSAAGA